ncbi:MAG: heme-binding protein [Planctomycetota bacterium]
MTFVDNSPQILQLTSDLASEMIRAAVAKSQELNVRMNIAVVDRGANLMAFHRMDGAWLGSIDIACKKAKTAKLFDMDTGSIGAISQPGQSLYNIEHSNDGLITFPGGLPVLDEGGNVIGAVGVSGSTVDDDHLVAQAAVDTVLK